MKCLQFVRTFNEEHHIGRLLEGVRHQTVQDVEVILVDSGSTDATATIAAQYSATVLYIPPAFSGPDSTILGHVPGLPPVTGKELAVTGNILLSSRDGNAPKATAARSGTDSV